MIYFLLVLTDQNICYIILYAVYKNWMHIDYQIYTASLDIITISQIMWFTKETWLYILLIRCCQSTISNKLIHSLESTDKAWSPGNQRKPKELWNIPRLRFLKVHLRKVCDSFGWDCLSGSGEESPKCHQFTCIFVIISSWNIYRSWFFIWKSLNLLYQMMLYSKLN